MARAGAVLSACIAASASVLATAFLEFEYNVPLQLVRPSEDHKSIELVEETMRRLGEHDQKIALVSVAGPYHSGKSFLLNALIEQPRVFAVGKRVEPQTMGIWLCRTNMTAADGTSEVWLMDSEGFFGPRVSDAYDARIFTVASLLGAHIVYNTVKVIDQQAVNNLEMLVRQAQLFRRRTTAVNTTMDINDFLSEDAMRGPLTWVVEDFIQDIPEEYRARDGAKGWLRSYMSTLNETETVGSSGEGDPRFLENVFSDIDVHTLFLPASDKTDLVDLSQVPWDGLNRDFKQEVATLRRTILSNLEPRTVRGKPMTGHSFRDAMLFIVSALQTGKFFQEMPSIWKTWVAQVAERSLLDAEMMFAEQIERIDTEEDPIKISEFNTRVDEAREECMRFYTGLLRDFDLKPNLKELQRRTGERFDSKKQYYHERISRWTNTKISESKDAFGDYLNEFASPTEPEELKRLGNARIAKSATDFQELMAEFSKPAPEGTIRGEVTVMPYVRKAMQVQLDEDLRAKLGAREHENERQIAALRDEAIKAADEAVEQDLRARDHSKAYGRAKMKDLWITIEAKCRKAFENRLSSVPWIFGIQAAKEYEARWRQNFENRMKHFQKLNEGRVSDFFRSLLERCKGYYNEKRANLVMAVSDSDLDAQIQSLANEIRELLEEPSRDLVDTDAYYDAMVSLTNIMAEGQRAARKMNVETWKVKSSEARSCAIKKNNQLNKECGLLCLFNKDPSTHKRVSREHLLACFEEEKTGNRMSGTMHQKVFDNWYNTDLAHHAERVWTNFCILSLFVGFCAILLFKNFCSRGPLEYGDSAAQVNAWGQCDGMQGTRYNQTRYM